MIIIVTWGGIIVRGVIWGGGGGTNVRGRCNMGKEPL